MTHDHALDFLIVREALARGDAAYVGMIGSRTKRVSFRRWLRRQGATVDAAGWSVRSARRGAGQAAGGDRGLRGGGDHAEIAAWHRNPARRARKQEAKQGGKRTQTMGRGCRRFFRLKEHGTNVRTEVIAGVTTFLTMAYIIFVNPQILATTGHGPQRGVRGDLSRGGAGLGDHGVLRQLADRDGAGHGAERVLRLRGRRAPWASPGSRRWGRCSSPGCIFLILTRDRRAALAGRGHPAFDAERGRGGHRHVPRRSSR